MSKGMLEVFGQSVFLGELSNIMKDTFCFNSIIDCEMVCNKGPYYMNRRPIVIKRWSVGFNFYAEVLKAYLAWLQFHNLPLAYWSQDSLSRIGSAVGIPKFADDCTTRCKRVKYAWVLAEVDIKKPVVKELDIEIEGEQGFKQQIAYEFIPLYCSHCCALGHICQWKKKMVKK